MAKVCKVCQRRAVTGNSRSHSNIASKRKMHLNLQTKKIDGKKTTLCTTCLKTSKKIQREKTV